jgi:hypothetical protein
MQQPTTIRVIKNKVTLLGKKRSFGEFIPEADFKALNPTVQNALISSKTVEVIGGNLTNEDVHEMLNKLIERVEKLEAKLAEKSTPVAPVPVPKISDQTQKETGRQARKGDVVQFDEIDADGNIYQYTGEVLRIRQGIAYVKDTDNKEHEVSLVDAVVIN